MYHDLVKALFAHVERLPPGLPGNLSALTTLILKDVELEMSLSTWFTFPDVRGLQHLELHHCKDVDMFLMPLVTSAEKPVLVSLVITHSLDPQADRIITMINNLLTSQQQAGAKLEKLILSLRNAKQLLHADAICANGDTLHTLVLDIRGDEKPNPNNNIGMPVPSTPGDLWSTSRRTSRRSHWLPKRHRSRHPDAARELGVQVLRRRRRPDVL